MGKKVRSAKGALVDFDLLKIKEQMSTAPTPTDVRARQDFIDRRQRRRIRKTLTTPVPKVQKVKVEPKMPGTNDQQGQFVAAKQPVVKKTPTKQKARPKGR